MFKPQYKITDYPMYAIKHVSREVICTKDLPGYLTKGKIYYVDCYDLNSINKVWSYHIFDDRGDRMFCFELDRDTPELNMYYGYYVEFLPEKYNTSVAVDNTPKCECGAAKLGYAKPSRHHYNWCKFYKE